jgi:hypothetical protein
MSDPIYMYAVRVERGMDFISCGSPNIILFNTFKAAHRAAKNICVEKGARVYVYKTIGIFDPVAKYRDEFVMPNEEEEEDE